MADRSLLGGGRPPHGPAARPCRPSRCLPPQGTWPITATYSGATSSGTLAGGQTVIP